MNKFFYYIKLGAFEYDKPDLYVNVNGAIVDEPASLMIFDNIDKARDFITGIRYMYENYSISLERI